MDAEETSKQSSNSNTNITRTYYNYYQMKQLNCSTIKQYINMKIKFKWEYGYLLTLQPPLTNVMCYVMETNMTQTKPNKSCCCKKKPPEKKCLLYKKTEALNKLNKKDCGCVPLCPRIAAYLAETAEAETNITTCGCVGKIIPGCLNDTDETLTSCSSSDSFCTAASQLSTEALTLEKDIQTEIAINQRAGGEGSTCICPECGEDSSSQEHIQEFSASIINQQSAVTSISKEGDEEIEAGSIAVVELDQNYEQNSAKKQETSSDDIENHFDEVIRNVCKCMEDGGCILNIKPDEPVVQPGEEFLQEGVHDIKAESAMKPEIDFVIEDKLDNAAPGVGPETEPEPTVEATEILNLALDTAENNESEPLTLTTDVQDSELITEANNNPVDFVIPAILEKQHSEEIAKKALTPLSSKNPSINSTSFGGQPVEKSTFTEDDVLNTHVVETTLENRVEDVDNPGLTIIECIDACVSCTESKDDKPMAEEKNPADVVEEASSIESFTSDHPKDQTTSFTVIQVVIENEVEVANSGAKLIECIDACVDCTDDSKDVKTESVNANTNIEDPIEKLERSKSQSTSVSVQEPILQEASNLKEDNANQTTEDIALVKDVTEERGTEITNQFDDEEDNNATITKEASTGSPLMPNVQSANVGGDYPICQDGSCDCANFNMPQKHTTATAETVTELDNNESKLVGCIDACLSCLNLESTEQSMITEITEQVDVSGANLVGCVDASLSCISFNDREDKGTHLEDNLVGCIDASLSCICFKNQEDKETHLEDNLVGCIDCSLSCISFKDKRDTETQLDDNLVGCIDASLSCISFKDREQNAKKPEDDLVKCSCIDVCVSCIKFNDRDANVSEACGKSEHEENSYASSVGCMDACLSCLNFNDSESKVEISKIGCIDACLSCISLKDRLPKCVDACLSHISCIGNKPDVTNATKATEIPEPYIIDCLNDCLNCISFKNCESEKKPKTGLIECADVCLSCISIKDHEPEGDATAANADCIIACIDTCLNCIEETIEESKNAILAVSCLNTCLSCISSNALDQNLSKTRNEDNDDVQSNEKTSNLQTPSITSSTQSSEPHDEHEQNSCTCSICPGSGELSLVNPTKSLLELAIKAAQKRCQEKDKIITVMTQELIDKVNPIVFKKMLDQIMQGDMIVPDYNIRMLEGDESDDRDTLRINIKNKPNDNPDLCTCSSNCVGSIVNQTIKEEDSKTDSTSNLETLSNKLDKELCICSPDCAASKVDVAEPHKEEKEDEEQHTTSATASITKSKMSLKSQCACVKPSAQYFPNELNPTKSLLEIAIAAAKERCQEKDRIIAIMTQDLSGKANISTFKTILNQITQAEMEHSYPDYSIRMLEEESTERSCPCSTGSINAEKSVCSINPDQLKIIQLQRLTTTLLYVKWTNEGIVGVVAYEIYLNGRFVNLVDNDKDNAILFTNEDTDENEVTIYAVIEEGRCYPEAIAIAS